MWSRLADRYELPQRLDWLAAESIRRLDAHFGSLGPLDPVAGAGELVAELAAAGVPLAVASSSVATRFTQITGPKVSSRATAASSGTSARTVGMMKGSP